jgi:hypothetical protein
VFGGQGLGDAPVADHHDGASDSPVQDAVLAAPAPPVQDDAVVGVDEGLDGSGSEENSGLVAGAIDSEHEDDGTPEVDPW